MLGIRTTPKEDLGASPAEMVYASTLTVPGDFTPQSEEMQVPAHLRRLREQTDMLRPIPTSAHGVDSVPFNVPKSLNSADYVYVRRDGKSKPLQNPYDGPFKVLVRGPKTFKVQFGNREETVSIDRLKAAVTEGKVQVAVPPKCGRPPNKPTAKSEGQQLQQTEMQNTQSVPAQSRKTTLTPSNAEITSRSG